MLTVDDYVQLPIIETDNRYAYGDDPSQFGDLFLPPDAVDALPVVLLIHGGCWRAQHGLAQLGQLAADLLSHGMAVWNIEYRRLGNGGGWPMTFHDVAAAADYLFALADKYPLDLTRVVIAGHSAGGHLGLWLAARSQLTDGEPFFQPNPLPIRHVVSLAGIPNMATAVARNICRGAPQELLGGLPDAWPERYRFGSPHRFLPLGLPHTHVQGVDDPTVPLDYVQHFVEASLEAGDTATLVELPDVGHFELVTATTPAWSTVREVIKTALGK